MVMCTLPGKIVRKHFSVHFPYVSVMCILYLAKQSGSTFLYISPTFHLFEAARSEKCLAELQKAFNTILYTRNFHTLNRARRYGGRRSSRQHYSLSPGTEAEYEPCQPGKGFSPHLTLSLVYVFIQDVFPAGHLAETETRLRIVYPLVIIKNTCKQM